MRTLQTAARAVLCYLHIALGRMIFDQKTNIMLERPRHSYDVAPSDRVVFRDE